MPPPDPQALAAEPYVIVNSETIVSMQPDGSGTRLQTFAIRLQAESAVRSFSVLSVAYPHSSETAEFVYARVRHLDGTMAETPVSESLDQPAPVTREAPFYSDLQIKQLPLKSLRVGDTLEWQARSVIVHPEVPGHFWGADNLSSNVVVLNELIELHTPLSVHPTVWTNPRSKAVFTETKSATERVDRWSHTDLQPTVGPAAEAAKLAEEKRLLTPDEQLDLTEGKLPDLAWTTFPDWTAVGAWYRSLSTDRAVPDAAIKAKVAELTAGKTTDLARAQALYTYVSMGIRYIGVAFGIGRFQPHTAAEVFANQYGDCKDKYTLLAAMFTAAGLHSDPVLIGAGVRFNPAVPSPAAFNHLIAHLELDGHEVWLDPTAEVAPWQALYPILRDHQALVIPASAASRILRTPASLPYPAYATSVVTGSLDSSLNSDSTIVLTFHDDNETALRALLRSVSPAEYGAFVQNLMVNFGFGGTTSDASIEHLADSSQPLALRFHYHRTHEADWGENRITATFQPVGLPAFSPDKPPTAAIQLGTPRSETSTVELTLPARWQAELPEPVHAHAPFATVDVTFRRDGGKLLEERKLVVLKKEVPATDFTVYQSWYATAGAGSYPYVQLIPPVDPASVSAHTAPDPPPPATSASPSDPKAAALVASAAEKMRSMDVDSARKLLDDANAINPSERGLWMAYAALASQFGAPAEAIDDLQRELRYHPEETRLYSYIGEEQQRRGDRDGALATYRAWSTAAPSSPEAATGLVRQLSAGKQFAEAVTIAQAALDRLSHSSTDLVNLRLATADAQTGAGDKGKAAATLAPLLDTVTDPAQVNTITYALAEASLKLPAAESAQRIALASLEAQTSSWTLSQAPALVNRQQATIAAAWDTLGWILYREGRYPEALAYIEPAARVLDHPAIRDHLHALAGALHNPALDQLDWQKLRTLPLGPAQGRHGTAELRLLIVDGAVADTGPFSTDLSVSNSSYKPGLTDGPALLKTADLHKLLPPGSSAHLVRNAMINCFNTVCQVVLIPLAK